MSEFHKKLQDILQKPFRADAADLDFGIYRIINYWRDQLQTFIDEELPAIVDNILNARAVVEAAQQKVEDMTQEIRQTLGDNFIDISGHLINRASDKKTVVIIWRETKGWQKEDYERYYQFIYPTLRTCFDTFWHFYDKPASRKDSHRIGKIWSCELRVHFPLVFFLVHLKLLTQCRDHAGLRNKYRKSESEVRSVGFI